MTYEIVPKEYRGSHPGYRNIRSDAESELDVRDAAVKKPHGR